MKLKQELEDLVANPGAGLQPKPEGGKALERLKAFLTERGLPMPETDPTPEKTGKGKKGKGTDSALESKADDYAHACSEAATSSQSESSKPLTSNLILEAPDTDLAPMSPPTATGPNWRFLGPSYMTNGQTYGDTRVNVSGRVSCIAVDPGNSNHILCGSAHGGVWESFNRGASWFPRTDYMPSLAVGALAFNPSAPNIVYCGTGEANWYGGSGAGVLRSTNGGTTWTLISAGPFVGRGFYDLIVDRANGNNLIAATNIGIYTSADAGVTWTLRRAGVCWDLSAHPNGGTNEILAACQTGLFRSINRGVTWTAVALPAGAPAGFERLAVDISRSTPTVAYAFGASGGIAYLYRRTGGVWAAVAPPAGLATGQAWYDWFLAVSPDNPAQIYLGAIEVHRGTLSGASWSWVTISNKAGDDIHPDQHAIAFDPTNANVIYIGNDGGLYTSPNRGINWTSLNQGLGITEIEYIAQDYGMSNWLMAGTQDNGSIRYTGNQVWDHIADGDGGDCGVNRADPNVVYHSYYGMGLERSTVKGNFGSFSWIFPSVPASYNALFYPPMEVCNDTVAQAGQTCYISRNRGTSWANVSFPGALTVASAMYIPNPDNVFVGTTNGRMFRITWSGAAWAVTELASPRVGAFMKDIHVNPSNLLRIWVVFSSLGAGGRVFRSDNGGVTWANLTAGLPNLPINAVEVDPGNPNRVWVAADIGVYQSLNAGATWGNFSDGLPNSMAADLLYHPHARVLRVGLRNRGVWEIPVDGWLLNPVCGVQFIGNLAPNQTHKWFTWGWPATWHILWTVMPTTPQPGAPQVSLVVQTERSGPEHVTYWLTVTNLTANPVSFEGRFEILSYY